jgi:hypothetical protein
VAICLTCAKRDNPFDPINYRELGVVCPPESLLTFKSNVAVQLASADHSILVARTFVDTMRADSSTEYAICSADGIIEAANMKKQKQNLIIDSLNQTSAVIDSLRIKSLLDTIKPIFVNEAYIDTFMAEKAVLMNSQLIANILIATIELSCSGNKTLLQKFADSAIGVLTTDSLLINSYLTRSNAIVHALVDSSDAVANYNALIVYGNTLLNAYNQNTAWRIQTDRLPHITSPDSLISSIVHATPGDTFIVNGELSTANLIHVTVSGTSTQPIVLLGPPQMTGIIDAVGGIIITNSQYISLVNLVIRNSTASGFKVEDGSGSILLDNCTISDNALYGVEAIDSDLKMVHCRILRNGKSGLRFSPTTSNQINLDNILIVKNHGHGIDLVSPSGYMNYVTVSNNDSIGINIPTFSNIFTINNSLITYNGEFGVKATVLPSNASMILLGYDDFYGNRKGDIDTTGHYSYLTLEPGYIDTANNNFAINPDSPLGKDIGYNENR